MTWRSTRHDAEPRGCRRSFGRLSLIGRLRGRRQATGGRILVNDSLQTPSNRVRLDRVHQGEEMLQGPLDVLETPCRRSPDVDLGVMSLFDVLVGKGKLLE